MNPLKSQPLLAKALDALEAVIADSSDDVLLGNELENLKHAREKIADVESRLFWENANAEDSKKG